MKTRIRAKPVIFLMICLMILGLAGCRTCPEVVPAEETAKIDWPAPPRPELLPVSWEHRDSIHCLNNQGAKDLIKNLERLKTHIAVLEDQIKEMEAVINR